MPVNISRILPGVVFFLFLSSIILMSTVPPVSRDALTHHLAVPKLYVQHGKMIELPDITPSYYPQLLDLLYCIPMIFENEIVPKYIHFTFALLTALLIFFYLKNRLNGIYGAWAALFFLSLPVIVKLSVTVYVDLGLIFFSTASLLALIKWQQTLFSLKWLIISAVACGLALSTKYNGLITFFLISVFVLLIHMNAHKTLKGQTRSIGAAFCFLIVAISIFSPWLVKNYIWTGNPVYPLYDHLFASPSESEITADDAAPDMNHFLIRKHIYKESWIETLAIPVRIFFQGEDDNPKLFDGKLHPLLFFLPLIAVILPGNPKNGSGTDQKILLVFSLLYILIVFFQQDMRIRWIGPAIPPLVILSAYGLDAVLTALRSRRPSRTPGKSVIVCIVLVCILASSNLIYMYRLFNAIAPLPYISGQISRSEYIEQFRPEFTAIEFANQALDDSTKILAFFLGNRRYYSAHEIRFDYQTFQRLVHTSESPEEIFARLKTDKVTTLLINYNAFDTWVQTAFGTDEEHQRIQAFFNQHTRRLFSANGHGLYQLTAP